jgi:hypothetical protein
MNEISAVSEHVAAQLQIAAQRARNLDEHSRFPSRDPMLGTGDLAVIDLYRDLGELASRLTKARRTLQVAVVRDLLRRGFTTREIGRHFGCSHQHVSALSAAPDD